MLAILCLGIGSGVPLGVVLTIFQAWATDAGLDLKTVSLVGLTQLPYTWKFIWSPVMDRYQLPFLGRRRGWMLVSQICMILGIFSLGQVDPKTSVTLAIVLATLVSFAGASHDIVIDAYRRDVLEDSELGFGSAMATNSYLIGFRFLTVVFGLYLADHVEWSVTYAVLASFVLIGVLGTFIAPEFEGRIPIPKSLRDAIVEPLKEFIRRPYAWEILSFIVIYKLGDNLAMHMALPFYLKMGFTKTDVGFIGKMVGFWCTFVGGFVGGILLTKLRLKTCLLWFGILQGLASLSFISLVDMPPDRVRLGLVVALETFTAGMGTAAFATLMARMTNRKFSATQYALLSSLMGVPRVVLPSFAGTSVEYISWSLYFIICTVAAAPGVVLVIMRTDKWLKE